MLRLVTVMVTVMGMGGIGCGSSDRVLTIGEVCEEVGDAVCDRVVNCGFIMSGQGAQCMTAFLGGCCANDGSCSTSANVKQPTIDMCTNAQRALTCSAGPGALAGNCSGL